MTTQQMIGQRVKYRRMEHHWSQRAFASQIGWKPDYLSRFEQGKWTQIDPDRLVLLSTTLHCSCCWLLGLADLAPRPHRPRHAVGGETQDGVAVALSGVMP